MPADAWPKVLEDLLPYTALYAVYYRYVSRELWKLCGKRQTGILAPIVLPAIAPAVAALLLRDLELIFDVAVEPDDTSRSNRVRSIVIDKSDQLATLCGFEERDARLGYAHARVRKAGGDLRFVRSVSIDWVRWRGRSADSKLMITATIWSVHHSTGSVETGEEAAGSVTSWMHAVQGVKQTLCKWLESQRATCISDGLRAFASRYSVEPVTRLVMHEQ